MLLGKMAKAEGTLVSSLCSRFREAGSTSFGVGDVERAHNACLCSTETDVEIPPAHVPEYGETGK